MKKNLMDKLRIRIFEYPFRKLTIRDRGWVEKACAEDGGISGHVNFMNMLFSQEIYSFDSFKKGMGCVLKRPWGENGKLYCQYPIGPTEKRKKAVEKIINIYSNFYSEFVFFGASDETLQELRDLYGSHVTHVENDRDGQEYILDTREQICLEGAEFSKRRKKIRRFKNTYNWTYEEITKENMKECFAINESWYASHEKNEDAVREQLILKLAFENYDLWNLQGGLLRIDGKAVAFRIGAAFNKEIYTFLFMKTLKEYRDTSLVLIDEFMKRHCTEYQFINCCEDLGIPGLREFKTNLHPKFLTSFYFVTVSF